MHKPRDVPILCDVQMMKKDGADEEIYFTLIAHNAMSSDIIKILTVKPFTKM